MDTTEKKQVQDPAAATAAEIQSRDDFRADDETNANLVEQEPLGKEPSNTDAGEAKGGDKGEVMAGKKRHLVKDATLFPMFFTMFGFRLIAGT